LSNGLCASNSPPDAGISRKPIPCQVQGPRRCEPEVRKLRIHRTPAIDSGHLVVLC
jgi:hypothetical protein